jgi:hypothetical protein
MGSLAKTFTFTPSGKEKDFALSSALGGSASVVDSVLGSSGNFSAQICPTNSRYKGTTNFILLLFNQIEKIRQTDSTQKKEKNYGKVLLIRIVQDQFFMSTYSTTGQSKLSILITSENINLTIGRPVNGMILVCGDSCHSGIDNFGQLHTFIVCPGSHAAQYISTGNP